MTTSPAKVLYKIEQLPVLQNRMYDTAAEARLCPKGDMILVENLETGLVYNEAFEPHLLKYDKHYQNEQAVSPFFRKHLDSVAEIVERAIGKESIIEIGCGKGFFLELLAAKGFDITGFDPAYEGSDTRVMKQYFTPELGIQAKGLVLRHVLEHIRNPVAFLSLLKQANGGRGKIYIEVPCFDWICAHRAWFDIFYEHVNYFRLSDFHRMFGVIHECGHLFGDQYLYVVAELSSLRVPRLDPNDRVNFPEDFLQGLEDKGKNSKDRQYAIWGGSSKGVIFALLKERVNQHVNIVIDINPAKQGKFIPGTGLLVHSPEKALPELSADAIIFVMNANYLEEIKKMSHNAYKCFTFI
ncbi:MAG: class I SAM-dependent methyltransferase [Thermodesulfobacteriota bacterium]